MAISLAAAVLLAGGVYADQWEWCALGVSIAACLCVSVAAKSDQHSDDAWGSRILGMLLAWMLFQLVPLPPPLVALFSPYRWSTVAHLRAAIGYNMGAWLPFSLVPSVTLERLLYVVPAMAAFVAAREMTRWWKPWITVAPIIVIAAIEGLLGVVQYYSMRTAGSTTVISGTYVNRNHFAGLLEMAFPLAIMCAVVLWRKRRAPFHQRTSQALQTGVLLGMATCLLASVILSLSRMGFLATLGAASVAAAGLLASFQRGDSQPKQGPWRWAIPVAAPLCILVLFSTNEMAARFGDLSTTELTQSGRTEIWREAAQMVSMYKWTGCGLGAFEQGLYRFKTMAPMNTVDFAHNDYLQILAELGLPGAALVAVFGLWILRRNLRFVFAVPRRRNWELGVGLLGSFVAIGLHSLVDFNLYIPANALTLAWLAGVAASPGLDEER
jgi:O-antigen ligase